MSENHNSNAPRQSWGWGEFPRLVVASNRVSPPKSNGAAPNADASPTETEKAVSQSGAEATRSESSGRSVQTPEDEGIEMNKKLPVKSDF